MSSGFREMIDGLTDQSLHRVIAKPFGEDLEPVVGTCYGSLDCEREFRDRLAVYSYGLLNLACYDFRLAGLRADMRLQLADLFAEVIRERGHLLLEVVLRRMNLLAQPAEPGVERQTERPSGGTSEEPQYAFHPVMIIDRLLPLSSSPQSVPTSSDQLGTQTRSCPLDVDGPCSARI